MLMTQPLLLRLTQFSTAFILCSALCSCGSSHPTSMGGAATARLASWNEPAPHGMVHIPADMYFLEKLRLTVSGERLP